MELYTNANVMAQIALSVRILRKHKEKITNIKKLSPLFFREAFLDIFFVLK